jgi:hypothetical protein
MLPDPVTQQIRNPRQAPRGEPRSDKRRRALELRTDLADPNATSLGVQRHRTRGLMTMVIALTAWFTAFITMLKLIARCTNDTHRPCRQWPHAQTGAQRQAPACPERLPSTDCRGHQPQQSLMKIARNAVITRYFGQVDHRTKHTAMAMLVLFVNKNISHIH